MKRVATMVVVLALSPPARRRRGRRAPRASPAQARTKATTAHGLGRLERRHRADRVQEARRRVRPEARRTSNINVVGGINDDKIFAALRAGQRAGRRQLVPVARTSASTARPAAGSTSRPYLKKDHINVNIFPAASRYYTQYKGKRCALPLLADTYGLYYNKTLFKEAGITRPPKTFSELVGLREEADGQEQRRVAQGRRLRPEPELLPRRRGHRRRTGR